MVLVNQFLQRPELGWYCSKGSVAIEVNRYVSTESFSPALCMKSSVINVNQLDRTLRKLLSR
jgi:hypothetical protein